MSVLSELPWQIKVDGLGYPSIYGTNEDGGEGDLVAHCFADHEHLLRAAPEMFEALRPFAEMCRVLERRSVLTFGKHVPDREVLCESSGEAGAAVLRMGDFRRADAALRKARGEQ